MSAKVKPEAPGTSAPVGTDGGEASHDVEADADDSERHEEEAHDSVPPLAPQGTMSEGSMGEVSDRSITSDMRYLSQTEFSSISGSGINVLGSTGSKKSFMYKPGSAKGSHRMSISGGGWGLQHLVSDHAQQRLVPKDIQNKVSVMSEIDEALGYLKPPVLEFIFVEPMKDMFGHACMRYTVPDDLEGYESAGPG
eukprot:CAMPEP_0119513358 /NCGR_PEP_ID=MMETSP1344-20130328/31491_1 /TAXON_ID=236787 /ORGANISM="Florenciella parvula, Strain CCMP2471" /LENGTH=194 /DNA_ID=CAMNT_0007550573 /DNA_START=129 /DNA_END=709 /DNA_ORIENTATION=-